MTTTAPGAPAAGDVRVVAVLGPDPVATAVVVRALARGAESAVAPGLAALPVDGDDGGRLWLLHPTGAPAPEVATLAALRGADALLVVLPAVGGPDPRTVQVWDDAAVRALPRVVAVTGLEVPMADFDEAVALSQRVLGDDVIPLQLPMHGDDDAVAGLLDLLTLRVHDWSTGGPVERGPDPEHVRMVEGLRGDLVESVLAESDDDTLLDRYLGGELLGAATLDDALAAAVAGGRLHPVLAVQDPVGTDELRALLTALPCARDVPPPAASGPDGSPVAPLSADPAGPLAAEVLAPSGDAWLVRVRSGTLRPGAPVHLVAHGRHGRDGRAGSLSEPHGAGCPAGEVCTVSGLAAAGTGDTLSAPGAPLLLQPWALPEPLHPVGLSCPDPAALEAALDRLRRADPTARAEAGASLLWSLDEQHAAQVLERLRADGAAVEAVAPDFGDGPDLALAVEVPSAWLRPVLRVLARHGAFGVEQHEDDERDVAVLRAELPRSGVPGLATALAAASRGTARGQRA